MSTADEQQLQEHERYLDSLAERVVKTESLRQRLGQDEWWTDAKGEKHRVWAIDPDYASNILRWLQRRAAMLYYGECAAWVFYPEPRGDMAYDSFIDELRVLHSFTPQEWLEQTPLYQALYERSHVFGGIDRSLPNAIPSDRVDRGQDEEARDIALGKRVRVDRIKLQGVRADEWVDVVCDELNRLEAEIIRLEQDRDEYKRAAQDGLAVINRLNNEHEWKLLEDWCPECKKGYTLADHARYEPPPRYCDGQPNNPHPTRRMGRTRQWLAKVGSRETVETVELG